MTESGIGRNSAGGRELRKATQKGLWNRLLNAVFPDNIYCISCGAVIDESRPYGLCDACAPRFDWVGEKTCSKCGKPLGEEEIHPLCHDCSTFEHAFDRGFTCAGYGLYERLLISDYKEGKRAYLAKKIARLMAARWEQEDLAADFIVSVPSSEKKIEERGFDQMGLIGREMGRLLDMPYCDRLLVKVKNTPAMRGMSKEERRMNVLGAYAVAQELPANAAAAEASFQESTALLIDDVYTTGSTVDACSAALKKAGIKTVYVLTFAAGGNYRPQDAGA